MPKISASSCRAGLFAVVLILCQATGPGAGKLPEAEGGIPSPARDPRPALKNFDPKTTAVFDDQDAFLLTAGCGEDSMESFEELVATNQSIRVTVTVDGVSVTTDNPPRLGIWDRRFEGAWATDGVQWLGVNENLLVVPQVTTLSFAAPINHFGINFTDFGDYGGGNLDFANDAGDAATAAFSGMPNGNHQFFGIITTGEPFTTVTLTHAVEGEFYGIDEIYFCLEAVSFRWRKPTGRVVPGR